MTNLAMLAAAMILAHLLLDYPMQGDFVSRAKNETSPLPGIPWHTIMWSHAAMHGAAVALLTGMWPLGVAETLAHYAADRLKCRGRISFNADQLFHLLCKCAWLAAASAFPGMSAWA